MCYRRGGERPTITDANLVLGYLNPDYFNAGEMRLDRDAAVAGLSRDIAAPLGLGVEEAAWGVHAAANANMERAMRIVSVERGRDPRWYAIVAFGGAGPVHAARLAKAIGAPRVIVPYGAGVGSAIGLLRAVPKIEVSVTRVMEVAPANVGAMRAIYDDLERRAAADVERLGVAGEPVWSRSGYLRYRGQGYEIRAEFPSTDIGDDFAGVVAESFHAAYARSYGYRDDAAVIEAVDWHLTATLPAGAAGLDLGWRAPEQCAAAPTERLAWFPETDGFAAAAVHDRRGLGVGTEIAGPAILEEPESTVVVPPGMTATVNPQGHVVIAVG